ncbi:MAG: M23 family metallopeptidase [Gemmatimonadota bacterium]
MDGVAMTGAGRSVALLLAFLGLSATGCTIPRIPLESQVTAPFGVRWEGVLPRVHRGVDLRAAEGTAIHAMTAGSVRYAGWMNGYGNVVWLDHRGGVLSVYAHLSEILVATGAAVAAGELVGRSGSTGNVTGPHLHFEVWKGGRPVDPIAYLGQRP